ncbi:MAG: type IV secretion protein Dot [Legionellales bacterium]
MRFILTTGSLDTFDTLRDDYETKSGVKLNIQPSFFSRPRFLGGKDINERNAQITFLEKINQVLQPQLLKLEKINRVLQPQLLKVEDRITPAEWQANLTASRTMLAACLYVLAQLSGSSDLYSIIKNKLGITVDNFLDKDDIECCCLAASRYMNLDNVNIALKEAAVEPISEKEWREFSKFLEDHCTVKKTAATDPSYPITSITRPLFGKVFACAGATIGILSGDVLSHSTKAMAAKYQLTAYVGSTILLGPLGPKGVALLAPIIANNLIGTFCNVSLGYALATSMNIVGQGVGIGAGLPLDLSYQLLWKACSLVGSVYNQSSKTPAVTGIRIADGVAVINGIVITLTPKTSDELAELTKDNRTLIHVDFESVLNDAIQGLIPTVAAPAVEIAEIEDTAAVPAVEIAETATAAP